MERLLELVDSGAVDMVIIAKLDRMTRSVANLAELLERFTKRGVALVSVQESLDTSSAAGRLVLNLLVSVSQWERETGAERTKDALAHKRANNERVGTIPYGKKLASDGVHLEIDMLEQAVINQMVLLRRAHRTLAQVAHELNQSGSRTRRNTPWKLRYVCEALKKHAA